MTTKHTDKTEMLTIAWEVGPGGDTPCEAPEVGAIVRHLWAGPTHTIGPWYLLGLRGLTLPGIRRSPWPHNGQETCNPDNTLPRQLGRFNPRANAKSVLHFNLYSCHWHTMGIDAVATFIGLSVCFFALCS